MFNKIKKALFTHEAFGWSCSILFIICYIPQIMKTLQLKEVGDVSLTMWIIQLIAYTCGGTYALYIKKGPLIFGYWAGWATTLYFLFLYWLYV